LNLIGAGSGGTFTGFADSTVAVLIFRAGCTRVTGWAATTTAILVRFIPVFGFVRTMGRQTLAGQVIAKQAFRAVRIFDATLEFDTAFAEFATAVDIRLTLFLVELVIFTSLARFRTIIVRRTIHCRD
jgi:hypothetical protein